MTRFARCNGSKGSNEREEEEATPWSLLSQFSESIQGSFTEECENTENEPENVQVQNLETSQFEKEEDNLLMDVDEKTNQDLSSESKTCKTHKRKQNKCLNCKAKGHLKKECPQLSLERRAELSELFNLKITRKGRGIGRKKKKAKTLENIREKPSINTEENKKNNNEFNRSLGGKEIPKVQGFVFVDSRKRLKEPEVSKKKICYRCRQPGHVMTSCPSSFKNEVLNNCFKCGSSTHSSKNCTTPIPKTSSSSTKYPFAHCFICQEKGHLAKSCPDNPRGLYPNGGGCRFCGSVEHLKAHCLRKTEKDEREVILLSKNTSSLSSFSPLSSNIEDESIDLQRQWYKGETKTKKVFKKTKVVKI